MVKRRGVVLTVYELTAMDLVGELGTLSVVSQYSFPRTGIRQEDIFNRLLCALTIGRFRQFFTDPLWAFEAFSAAAKISDDLHLKEKHHASYF